MPQCPASAAAATAADNNLRMSVFNAVYLVAIALAMAGWLWLIVEFIEWAIGI
jgi:hypothetical protein